MLLKSLAVSVAAALLGPTLGIATFLAVDGAYPAQPLAAASSPIAAETTPGAPRTALRAFAPSGLWYGQGAEDRPLSTAAADLSADQSGWQTVVSCPDGRTLSGEGSCQSATQRPQS
jgi:hypothetical protein